MEVPVFEAGNQLRPAEIAKRGLAEAKKKGVDVVIVDTAGRLQVHPVCMRAVCIGYLGFLSLDKLTLNSQNCHVNFTKKTDFKECQTLPTKKDNNADAT